MNIASQFARQITINTTKFLSKIQYHKYPFFLIYHLRGYKFKNTRDIINLIQPGDILLRTYDNYVTSLLIPGVWKHAGIVVDGENIVHALGEGVIKEDIIQFCRTDHVMVLRMNNLSKKQAKDIVNLAKNEIGKPYDYDFLTGPNKFYCSELVVFCYNGLLDIVPKANKVLGLIPTRPVISPDDLLACTQLEIVYKSN